MNCFLRMILCCILQVIALASHGQLPNPDLPWNLVWQDDFLGPPLDDNRWCRIDWRAYSYNREDLRAFRTDPQNLPDNLSWQSVNNGALTYITQTVRKEIRSKIVNDITTDGIWDLSLQSFKYTAPARMVSRAKFKYGYFEIRCRLPDLTSFENNLGLGANFWLYKEQSSVISELDIFEFQCIPPRNHVQTCNVHQTTLLGGATHDSGYQGPPIDYSEFHTFGAWWGPDFVRFYRDGVNYRNAIVPIQDVASEMIAMPMIIDINVFTRPRIEFPDANTRFPYEYDIDYVRVYQLNADQCNFDFVNCSPLPALPSIYNSITIGGGGGCIYSAANPKVLTSRTSITVLPEFTCALGSELTLQIEPDCYKSENIYCTLCTCD